MKPRQAIQNTLKKEVSHLELHTNPDGTTWMDWENSSPEEFTSKVYSLLHALLEDQHECKLKMTRNLEAEERRRNEKK